MVHLASNSKSNLIVTTGREFFILAAILIVAAWFRFYQLSQVPPGLTHDEANNAHDAAGVLTGTRPIYFSTGYGHEPLYTYLAALVSAPTGVTSTTLRLATALCGLGVVAISYLLVRSAFDLWVALVTAAGLAVSFWPVFTHRQGLRPTTLPLLFATAIYFLWRGLGERGKLQDWLLAGLFAGGSFYTYMASRTMLPALAILAIYLALFHRPIWRRVWCGFLVMLMVVVAVAGPLIIHLITHPEQETRVEQLLEPFDQARQGNFEPLFNNAIDTLQVFSFTGDTQWRYNLPGRAVFDPLTSIFLYLGLGLALWRWRQPAYAFLLLWLFTGLFPALATGGVNSVLRMMGAQPAIYLLVALGIVETARWLWARGRPARWVTVIGIVALLSSNAWQTYNDYFRIWAAEPDVREVYHTNLCEIAHYLDGQPAAGQVAISTEYPLAFHDPYILEMCMQRQDITPRWFDGRGALVIPAGGMEARYIFPAAADLHPALRQAFFDSLEPIATKELYPDDINNAFAVYRQTLAGQLETRLDAARNNPVLWSSEIEFEPGDPDGLRHSLTWPVQVGQAAFLGYETDRLQMTPGERLQLLSYWLVLETPDAPAIIFAHLLEKDSRVRGGQDRLDAPVTHWQRGDIIIQIHTLALDAGAKPGVYQLEIGFYTTETLERWPVFENETPVADRLLLHSIKVKSR